LQLSAITGWRTEVWLHFSSCHNWLCSWYCTAEAVVNKILFLPLLPLPAINKLYFGGCVFCELVSICSSGMRCGTCERHETELTLLIFPVLENSCSESVLIINVVNSSIVILLKGHTVGVVHVGVPKDHIYLNLLCHSYVGNILFRHSILGQLKPIFKIVEVPFNIILLCLVPGRKCSRNARSWLFGCIRFHYRPRCQVSCHIYHGFHQLSTRMPSQYFDNSMKIFFVTCGDANFSTGVYSIPFYSAAITTAIHVSCCESRRQRSDCILNTQL